MRTRRLFTEQPLSINSEVTLESGPAHHLIRVLRAKVNEKVVLFNGDGDDYHGVISGLSRQQITIRLERKEAVIAESPLRTHLGLSLSKGDRFDWALQKATELGVTRVTPLLSERVDVRLSADRLAKRHDHWLGVVRSASEQCQRARVPDIAQAVSLGDWLVTTSADCKLVLHHHQRAPLGEVRPDSVALLIGPEGGLSDTEVTAAEDAGFERWCIGPRVLRTETAPVVALTALGMRWGDLM